MLMVPAGTTVTPVTDSPPTLPVDVAWTIDTSALIAESFALNESICGGQNLTFGSMVPAYCSFSVKNENLPTLLDEMMDVYIYFEGNSDTLFQVGQYIVYRDKYTADRSARNIEAYDVLEYLKDYDITEWYNQVYANDDYLTIAQLRTSLFTWLNTEITDYTISQEVVVDLPNDDYILGKNIESDSISFQFYFSKVLELMGCFGHINRQGVFEYKYMEWYDAPAKKTFTDALRIPPTQYDDITVLGIAYVVVYDKNNIRQFKVGSTNRKYPNKYYIIDSHVLQADVRSNWKSDTKEALSVMREQVTHLRYKPCTVNACGNLCLEVGDRIDVQYGTDENDNALTFYSYALTRSFRGIQAFRDVYSALGDKRQPAYKISNDRWHDGETTEGSSGYGSGGVSEVKDLAIQDFCETIRNIGFRLLDEPSATVTYDDANNEVNIKWTDPADITSMNPADAEWKGTVVVRKDGSAPRNRWDGTLLANSIVRDEHSTDADAVVDNTVSVGNKYYYGIFPYDTRGDYRFTKVFCVNTGLEDDINAPTISNLAVNGLNITATFTIPQGTYTGLYITAKKDRIPTSKDDGVKITLADENVTTATFQGLDSYSLYYFVIFTESDAGNASSDPESATTNEGHTYLLDELLKTTDFTHMLDAKATGIPGFTRIADVSPEYYGSDYVIVVGQYNASNPYYSNSKICVDNPSINSYIEAIAYIPIKHIQCSHIKFDIDWYTYYYARVKLAKVENNSVVDVLTAFNGVADGRYDNLASNSIDLDCSVEADYIVIEYGTNIFAQFVPYIAVYNMEFTGVVND